MGKHLTSKHPPLTRSLFKHQTAQIPTTPPSPFRSPMSMTAVLLLLMPIQLLLKVPLLVLQSSTSTTSIPGPIKTPTMMHLATQLPLVMMLGSSPLILTLDCSPLQLEKLLTSKQPPLTHSQFKHQTARTPITPPSRFRSPISMTTLPTLGMKLLRS